MNSWKTLLRRPLKSKAEKKNNRYIASHQDVTSVDVPKSEEEGIEMSDGVDTNCLDASIKQTPDISPTYGTQTEVLSYLRKSPTNITFIHGKAGSGKTYLINQVTKNISSCQILTPTNLSASLYPNASTIHSFFWGALDDLEEGYQNPENLSSLECLNFKNADRLRSISFLIFDEISMVRSDLFEMTNRICQSALGNNKPFGGKKVVLVGDMFQLPPIVSSDAVLEYLHEEYGGIYFFNSHVLRNNIKEIKLFELNKSYRHQQDPSFEKLLDTFRRPLTGREKIELINAINSRVTDTLPSDGIYIASSNDEVRKVNEKKLSQLGGKEHTLEAEYKILKKESTDHIVVKHSELSHVDNIHTIILPSQYDSVLKIKKGARVTLTKNSKHWGYINGDFGVVEGYDGQSISIRIDRTGQCVLCPNPNDRYKANQINEYRYEMTYDPSAHKLVRQKPYIQKTTQLPVKLAYAFTIHKSQGQTYSKVIVDLNSHIFAPGQLYVALSRAKSLSGLYLTKPITYSDIISDDTIFDFLNEVRWYNDRRYSNTKYEKETCQKESYVVQTPACSNFINFIRNNEQNTNYCELMQHTLRGYDVLLKYQEYEKAHWELQKVVDLIISTYQADDYNQLIRCIKKEPSNASESLYALNAIFEIYTDIVRYPRKQYQTEDRTLICKL